MPACFLESDFDFLLKYKGVRLAAVRIACVDSARIHCCLREMPVEASTPFSIVCDAEHAIFYNGRTDGMVRFSIDEFPTPDEMYRLYMCCACGVSVGSHTGKILNAGYEAVVIVIAAVGALFFEFGRVVVSLLARYTHKDFIYISPEGHVWTNVGACNRLSDGGASEYAESGSACAGECTGSTYDMLRFDTESGSELCFYRSFEEWNRMVADCLVLTVTVIEYDSFCDDDRFRTIKRKFASTKHITIAAAEDMPVGTKSCPVVTLYPRVSSHDRVLEFFAENDSCVESDRGRFDSQVLYGADDAAAKFSGCGSRIGRDRVTIDIPPKRYCVCGSWLTTNDNGKININSGIMARKTSFEHQIELAESLKAYLHGFQERLGYVAKNYRDKCNDLYEAGMMDETYADFEQNYMRETVIKIASVVERINDCDIPFVERYIGELEQMRSNHNK